MKKVIKYFSVYLTVLAILACTAFSFPVDTFAAQVPIEWEVTDVLSSPNYVTDAGDIASDGNYTGNIYFCNIGDNYPAGEYLEPGTYLVTGVPATVTDVGVIGTFLVCNVYVIDVDNPSSSYVSILAFGAEFEIPAGCIGVVGCQSFNELPALYRIEPDSGPEPLYYSAFEMFANFIYGEGAELTAEQNMVLTILATACALFVIVVPFLIVVWFIRLCTGG